MNNIENLPEKIKEITNDINTIFEPIKEKRKKINEKIKELNGEICKSGTEKLVEVFYLLSSNFQIEWIKMRFFTPYFNDGDECIKTCYTEVKLADETSKAFEVEQMIADSFNGVCDTLLDSFNEECLTITSSGVRITPYTNHD